MTDASAHGARKRTILYRYFDKSDRLLYVGISTRGPARWKEHAADKPWYCDVVRATVEHFTTAEQAANAERRAIKTESPVYNVVHNGTRGSSNAGIFGEPTYPARPFDYKRLAVLPAFTAAQRALDDLAHAMNDAELDGGVFEFMDVASDMAMSLAYGTTCDRDACRMKATWTMHIPYELRIKGEQVEARYLCSDCHTPFRCWWHINPNGVGGWG